MSQELDNVLPTTGKDDPSGHGSYLGYPTYWEQCGCGAGRSHYVSTDMTCNPQTSQMHVDHFPIPKKVSVK